MVDFHPDRDYIDSRTLVDSDSIFTQVSLRNNIKPTQVTEKKINIDCENHCEIESVCEGEQRGDTRMDRVALLNLGTPCGENHIDKT